MTLGGPWWTLLIALVSAQPPIPSFTPSELPAPPQQYWPGVGYATIAPQVFTISANTWQIINMGPWGAVYGIPLCNPQMYRAGGWVIRVTREFPYVLPGSAGTSTRFIVYGQPMDYTGRSWILDNGYCTGSNFAPLPIYRNTVTRAFPTLVEWPWLLTDPSAQPFDVLYVLVQNTVDYGLAQPAPYNIVVSLTFEGEPQGGFLSYMTFAKYPFIPWVNQRPDNLESWRANSNQPSQSHIYPFSQFSPALNYSGGPPRSGGLSAILYMVVYNVRQLVTPFGYSRYVPRQPFNDKCPQCNVPGRPLGGPSFVYKVGLPVCAPLGQISFTVRVIVTADNPASYFNVYACSPEQAQSSTLDSSGYGCDPSQSPANWTDTRGSLYSDIQLYNQSFVWLSIISRAQYVTGYPIPRSNFLIMATSYPGQNLTETQWLEDFSVPLSVDPPSVDPFPVPYYLMWQNLWVPKGNYLLTSVLGPPLGQLTF